MYVLFGKLQLLVYVYYENVVLVYQSESSLLLFSCSDTEQYMAGHLLVSPVILMILIITY